MPPNPSKMDGGAGRTPPHADHKHRRAVDNLENTPHYWLFLAPEGVLAVRATGQKQARELAGPVAPKYCLPVRSAGLALRLAELKSQQTGMPIVDLAELEAAAKSDPEPDSGSKRAHAQRKGAK